MEINILHSFSFALSYSPNHEFLMKLLFAYFWSKNEKVGAPPPSLPPPHPVLVYDLSGKIQTGHPVEPDCVLAKLLA
jgi:hypothetical protein